MVADQERTYFWCLKHHRVEDDTNACQWSDRLGPYGTRDHAERALQTVAERNERFDAEDEEWEHGTTT
ncbi:MAG: hypothetical protein DLM59_13835 [Pseudonocardiales bacterium]|nr:MAG: hypothetical protein DLM59_13835 [Pseudonocardiales bacterium]